MKKYLFLAAACLSFAFTACSDDNTQDEGENTAPTCKITEPLEGETYDANLPLTIKGRINDKENNVSAVKLTVGGETKFACVDGPDFDGHKVDWDLAVKRNQMYKDFEAHKYEETCNLFKKEAE